MLVIFCKLLKSRRENVHNCNNYPLHIRIANGQSYEKCMTLIVDFLSISFSDSYRTRASTIVQMSITAHVFITFMEMTMSTLIVNNLDNVFARRNILK